jgi:hypothetical protein
MKVSDIFMVGHFSRNDDHEGYRRDRRYEGREHYHEGRERGEGILRLDLHIL